MAVVGDFTPTETTDPQADPDEFTFFGETFEIPATVGTGAMITFTWLVKGAEGQRKRGESMLAKARTESDAATAEAEKIGAYFTEGAAVYQYLTACLGVDQLTRFLEVSDANGVTIDGLMEVSGQIQEVIADRPTRRSADSSAGPSTSGQPSTASGSGLTDPDDNPWMTPREQQAAEILAASTSLADLPA